MSLTFRIDNNIGYVEFDHPDSKVNILTSDVVTRLGHILDEVATKPSLKGVVLVSKKKDVFIAGADIKEIEGITQEEDGAAKSKAGQDIFNKLEDLPMPTIAVIDGVALGGGCELALACTYRIATFNEKVKIGLPEVNLGFVPGFGGTYRMPRLLGLSEGLKMIVSGRQVSGEQALKVGLVDRLYPQTGLEAQVITFVEQINGSKKRPSRRAKGIPALLDKFFLGQQIVFTETRKAVLGTTKGFYPAPEDAVNLIQKTFYLPRDLGMKLEAQAFGRLAITSISKNLVHVFYLSEKFKKLMPQGAENVKPKTIHRCAVIGAGIMGGGIAQLLSNYDIWARLKDVNYDALAKGLQAAKKIFDQAVKRKRFKPAEAERKMAQITTTLDYSGFKDVDMVIEAVVENMDIKKKVFKELSGVVLPETILCTNTSALSVTEMAQETKDPSKVIGLHFFNPVHRMPLIEIVTTPMTSTETIVTTLNLTRRLGKTPILVKDSCGFLVNRVLLGYINEAGRILEEGGDISGIDHVMTKFGMPMGPFLLSDEVGLDVGIKVLHILEKGLGERFKPVDIFEKIFAKGFLGKKSGKGYYLHGKKRMVNPEAVSLVTVKSSGKPNPQEWKDRMIFIMINEAARCLEEGIVDHASTVDAGMIMGTGFPPFLGGLLKYGDDLGITNVIETLELFAGEYGERFKPCRYLADLKRDNRKFY